MDEMSIDTPYYIIDESKLVNNLEILYRVKEHTGCKILLAQKAFSLYPLYPTIARYLDGVSSSGLFESRLGIEEFDGEVHAFCTAFRDSDMEEVLGYVDHIVFNSINQLERYGPMARKRGVRCGLRLNPEHSTQSVELYDPCSPYSRLGVRESDFKEDALELLDGFHMHTLCMQDSMDLDSTVRILEKRFGKYLSEIKWLNLGGGHHITRPNYNIALLEDIITHLQKEYGLQIYLEPGEAVALNAGELVSSVLDIVYSDMPTAILDTSAACHMPDVLEMPFVPPVDGARIDDSGPFICRLAGCSCLAGDVMGEYSFEKPVSIGDKIRFQDMAIYTMVKNNTFNGIPLPSIWIRTIEGDLILHKKFGYDEFKGKL